MYAVRAIYDGVNIKPLQPIPIKESCEVVITFPEFTEKNSTDILKFFNCWNGEPMIDLDEIMAERENFSMGRETYDFEDFS